MPVKLGERTAMLPAARAQAGGKRWTQGRIRPVGRGAFSGRLRVEKKPNTNVRI
jgi:hypothetical protein